jgi:hypothetical protein
LHEAEQAITNGSRDASGIRDVLGVGADETFRLLDEARAVAEAAVAASLRAAASAPALTAGASSLATPGGALAAGAPASWVEAPVVVMMAVPFYMQLAGTLTPGQTFEKRDPYSSTTNGVTSGGETHIRIVGSRLEGTWTLTQSKAAPNGTTVTESWTVTVVSELCPDVTGAVPLSLSLRTRSSAGTRGYDYGLEVTATGYAGEDGALSGYAMAAQLDVTLAPGNTLVPGGDGMFVEYAGSESLTGLGTGNATGAGGRYAPTRWSSRVDDAFASRTRDEQLSFARMYLRILLNQAEGIWLGGHCVEVLVPERQRVAPSSSTRFTARVRHKYEGSELTVPVVASMKSGAVSVTPAGTDVMAPATLAYQAPGERDREAKVEVLTRSRRGGAVGTATFVTGVTSYRATGTQGDASYSGLICSLERPFDVNMLAGAGSATFAFTPVTPVSGTMTETGGYPGGIVWSGTGTYTVVGLDTPTPRIEAPFRHVTTTPVGTVAVDSVALIDLQPYDDPSCAGP